MSDGRSCYDLPCCNLQEHGNFRSQDDDLLLLRVHTGRHYSLASIYSSFEDTIVDDSWAVMALATTPLNSLVIHPFLLKFFHSIALNLFSKFSLEVYLLRTECSSYVRLWRKYLIKKKKLYEKTRGTTCYLLKVEVLGLFVFCLL